MPAQHVCTAEFPGAPWERAADRLFVSHPLCFVADAWAVLQQVVLDNYLLVDVMGALEMGAETLHFEVCLARMAYDRPVPFFPCGNTFPQASL